MDAKTSDAGKPAARAELFVLSGPDVGRSFEIVHGSTVGRAPDRGVVLRDRSISRHHAHFECADATWSIVDDGSTNGFVVDGVRRERALLTDLREFVIGEVLVRVRMQASAAPGTPAAPAPAAAAPIVRPAAPIRAPPPEIEIEDEIQIDSEPAATSPTVARRPQPIVQVTSAPTAPGPRAMSAPDLSARGRRILQYHKQDARSGILVTDLEQRPPWVRALLYVLVLAFAGALAFGVYRAVLSMREGISHDTEP